MRLTLPRTEKVSITARRLQPRIVLRLGTYWTRELNEAEPDPWKPEINERVYYTDGHRNLFLDPTILIRRMIRICVTRSLQINRRTNWNSFKDQISAPQTFPYSSAAMLETTLSDFTAVGAVTKTPTEWVVSDPLMAQKILKEWRISPLTKSGIEAARQRIAPET